MSRTTPGQDQALERVSSGAVLLVRWDAPPPLNRVTFHNGIGVISWQGDDYVNLGDAQLAASIVSQDSDVRATPLRIALSGLTGTIGDQVLGLRIRGTALYMWVQMFYENKPADDPIPVGDGRWQVDTATLTEGLETDTVTMTAESLLANGEVANVSRYTDADQRLRFPNDRGLEYVAQMGDKTVDWGGQPASAPGGGAPPIPSRPPGVIPP